jgi:tripartite-type tricarboxylate transporter receptor subunit TctC
MLTRRHIIAGAAAVLGGAADACAQGNAPAAAVGAQDWPKRSIRIIVAFGPGGGTDIVGRIIAQAMQERLGQPVVVENRPAAAGTLGNEVVARADKDGYTLGIMTAGQIIAAVMSKSLRYDTKTAFDPVSLVATAGLIIVTRPDFPAGDVTALIAAAKANPGKLSFGSAGFGATQHFSGELFRQTAGIEILHVPFRTSPEAIAAVLGKQVDVLFETVSAVLGQVQSGQLKALAVTGKERFPAVPTVPAAIESGLLPGYDATTWYGFFAPRGTPPEVIGKLNKVINEILGEQAVRERLGKAGVVVQGSTPDAFGRHMLAEFDRWSRVREAAGIPQQQ